MQFWVALGLGLGLDVQVLKAGLVFRVRAAVVLALIGLLSKNYFEKFGSFSFCCRTVIIFEGSFSFWTLVGGRSYDGYSFI